MKHVVALIVVLLLAVSCEGLAKKPIRKYRKCTDISDCPCGSVCVRRLGGILFNTPCTSLFPRLCACKRGCQVFDKVIPAGQSQRVYCNTCNCPQNSASTKGIPASSNVENLSPQVIRQIAKQVADLTKNPPEGIKVIANEEDITDIQANIEGPAGTPYAGGMFKMKLVLGKNFPSEPPKGFFLTKIFHPNVASNGEICVNTLKKDWNADLGIKHLLLTIKCLLIVPNPESALNEEAGKLLLEQYDDYSMRAKIFTEIHAKPHQVLKEGSSQDNIADGPLAKKHAGDKKTVEKKKKDKKKVLKRL